MRPIITILISVFMIISCSNRNAKSNKVMTHFDSLVVIYNSEIAKIDTTKKSLEQKQCAMLPFIREAGINDAERISYIPIILNAKIIMHRDSLNSDFNKSRQKYLVSITDQIWLSTPDLLLKYKIDEIYKTNKVHEYVFCSYKNMTIFTFEKSAQDRYLLTMVELQGDHQSKQFIIVPFSFSTLEPSNGGFMMHDIK